MGRGQKRFGWEVLASAKRFGRSGIAPNEDRSRRFQEEALRLRPFPLVILAKRFGLLGGKRFVLKRLWKGSTLGRGYAGKRRRAGAGFQREALRLAKHSCLSLNEALRSG